MEQTYTLTLTENCNLSCVYCYEHNRNGRTMTLETAEKIVSEACKSLKEDDLLTVDFFGGEPFLEFERIREIVEYVNSEATKGRLRGQHRFFATTNGTLVHGKIQEWLKEQHNFYLGLSLDGTKRMHDINRSSSFDQIDLGFFSKMYPAQYVKMTVSDLTLPHLAEGVIFLHNKGFKVACNLAYGIDWTNSKFREQLIEQLEELILFYLENPRIERATLLSRNIAMLGYCKEQEKKTVRKWCGTGTAMHTYDTDGARYPCQFFMPVSCGEEKAKRAWESQFKEEFPIECVDARCQKCIVRDCCPTCYGSNYVATGDILKRDPHLCTLEKIIFYANACLAIQQWNKGHLNDLSDEEVLATLIASRDIINSFESEISHN